MNIKSHGIISGRLGFMCIENGIGAGPARPEQPYIILLPHFQWIIQLNKPTALSIWDHFGFKMRALKRKYIHGIPHYWMNPSDAINGKMEFWFRIISNWKLIAFQIIDFTFKWTVFSYQFRVKINLFEYSLSPLLSTSSCHLFHQHLFSIKSPVLN